MSATLNNRVFAILNPCSYIEIIYCFVKSRLDRQINSNSWSLTNTWRATVEIISSNTVCACGTICTQATELTTSCNVNTYLNYLKCKASNDINSEEVKWNLKHQNKSYRILNQQFRTKFRSGDSRLAGWTLLYVPNSGQRLLTSGSYTSKCTMNDFDYRAISYIIILDKIPLLFNTNTHSLQTIWL